MTSYLIDEPQTQPTLNSCVSTCIAMVLGKPVKEVIADLHEDYFDKNLGDAAAITYLRKAGKIVSAVGTDIQTQSYIYTPGHYLLTVPSLNYKCGFHSVLLAIDYHEGKLVYQLLDPNEGWEDRKSYTWVPELVEEHPEKYVRMSSYQIWATVHTVEELESRRVRS